MATPAYQRERGRLAEALKAVRVGAGLSGARLAEMLGWQQSKVSKIETRKQLSSEDDIALKTHCRRSFHRDTSSMTEIVRSTEYAWTAVRLSACCSMTDLMSGVARRASRSSRSARPNTMAPLWRWLGG